MASLGQRFGTLLPNRDCAIAVLVVSTAPVGARYRRGECRCVKGKNRADWRYQRGSTRQPVNIEVSLLERAGRDPRLSTISRLARALGIPAATLLDEID